MSKLDDVFHSFIDLCKNNKKPELLKKLFALNDSQLFKLLDFSFVQKGSDLINFLKACFYCLSQADDDTNKKRKLIIKYALGNLRKCRLESNTISSLISVLVSEIDKLQCKQMLDLVNYYFDALCKDHEVCNPRWIEILPKLFQNISQQSSVQLNIDEDQCILTGKEAQDRLFEEFCNKEWHPSNLVCFVGCLKEINVGKPILNLVAQKVLNYLKKLQLIDLPAIIYQLLMLVNVGEKTNVICGICNLFVELDETENKADSCSEKESVLKEIEGTVMVHVMFAVKQNQEFGKIFLNLCKASHRFALKPFNTALLLSVSQISRFSEQVLDLMKTILMSCLRAKEKKESSKWIRTTIINDLNVERVLKQLTKDCSYGWDYVLDGLRELGLYLLETHLPKVAVANGKIVYDSNNVAHTACRWGELIVLECFRNHHSTRSSLIHRVMDAVFLQSSSALYFIELLSRFVERSPQSVLECKQKIFEHFDHLSLLPCDVAIPFIKVFMPLVRLKPDLRDKLAEVLKRAIFSKEIEARKTAVGGFLLFLRYLQVMSAFLSNSQSQSQTFPTFSSQALSLGNNQNQKWHYEKLCLEIVCCLRKAMSQQGEIRKMLYIGLFHAARHNQQILPPVIDLLYRQLDQYVAAENQEGPPILLANCVSSSKQGAILMEPLGCLIMSLHACFLSANSFSLLDEANSLKVKTMLSSVVKKLGAASLEDFNLDKSSDYSFDTAAGANNTVLALELLSIYEASLEICWKTFDFKTESVELICDLQKFHSDLVEMLQEKNVAVNKKAGIGKINAAPPNVGRPTVGGKKFAFTSIIDLASLYGFMESLLRDQELPHQAALDGLRMKEFLKWFFLLSNQRIQNFLTFPKLNLSKSFETLCKFARLMLLLYIQDNSIVESVKRRSDVYVDISLEVFTSILNVICVLYSDKIESFLNHLDLNSNESNDNIEFTTKLYNVIRTFLVKMQLSSLLSLNNKDDENVEEKTPKHLVCLIRVVEILLKFLPTSADQYEQAYNSVLLICEGSHLEEATVAKSLWSLLFQMQLQINASQRKLVQISQNIYKWLGDFNKEEDDVYVPDAIFESINKKTTNSVLHAYFHYLDISIENCNYVIVSQKQNLTARDYTSEDRDKVDTECCERCCLIIAVFQDLLKADVPQNFLEVVIKSLQKFYTVLSALARYYLLVYQKKLGQHCPRFDKLVKKSLTDFTPKVYKFLSFARTVEHSVQNKKKRAQNALTAKTKIMREMKVVTSLVFAIENYEKSLIQLGAKCKKDFMHGAKPSTNCDFRIDQEKLRQALDANQASEDKDEEITQIEDNPVANENSQNAVAKKRKTQNAESTVPTKRKK